MLDVPPPLTLGLRLIQSIALHPLVLLRCHERGQEFQMHPALPQLHFSWVRLQMWHW